MHRTLSVSLALFFGLVITLSCAKRSMFRPRPKIDIAPEDFVAPPDNSVVQMQGRMSPSMLRNVSINSLSVVVTARNSANKIINTLESIDNSISEYFQQTNTNPQVEVIIVDDASEDSTDDSIKAFIEAKKHTQAANPLWRLVTLPVQMHGGAAKNMGITQSKADVLFFAEAGDIYHKQHMLHCLNLLQQHPNSLIAKTDVEIDFPVRSQWHNAITLHIASAICIWRRFHDFVGGFPEGPWQDQYEDMFYQDAIMAVLDQVDEQITWQAGVKTVLYHLPEHMRSAAFSKEPPVVRASIFNVLPHSPFVSLQRIVAVNHLNRLKKKMYNIELAKDEAPRFPLWNIYQSLSKQLKIAIDEMDLVLARAMAITAFEHLVTVSGNTNVITTLALLRGASNATSQGHNNFRVFSSVEDNFALGERY